MPEPAFTLPGIRVHLPRNRCSRSPESVFTMLWNGCSPSAGICVHDAPEYAQFGLRQLTAGLGANLWGCSAKLALARFHAPRSCVRTPVPDPWLAFGHNPARSGCHGERDARQRRRRSRRVRFCRHPSRPRVEWPDLPGRGTRQRLSVRRQNLSVPHYHRKANHRHPLVRTTLFWSDAQAQGLI